MANSPRRNVVQNALDCAAVHELRVFTLWCEPLGQLPLTDSQ